MHSCIGKKQKFLEAKNDKKAQIKEHYIWEKRDKSQGVSKVGKRIKDTCLKLVLPKVTSWGEKIGVENVPLKGSPVNTTACLSLEIKFSREIYNHEPVSLDLRLEFPLLI